MATLAEATLVETSLAEVWDYYFEPGGWPAWVDQFGSVEGSDGYPEAGGSLRWRSTPAGRGTVTEHVLEHEPRRFHRIAFSDPETSGELRTTFAIEGERVRVEQALDYKLRRRGPFTLLTDRLFIRSQMRGSLRRSLQRLTAEVEEAAATPPGSASR